MTRRSNPTKELTERKYRHGVDVPVPEGGLGRTLNRMYEWPVGEHHGANGGHRFYAPTKGDATAFQEAFGGQLWEIPEGASERDMLSPAKRNAARSYIGDLLPPPDDV